MSKAFVTPKTPLPPPDDERLSVDEIALNDTLTLIVSVSDTLSPFNIHHHHISLKKTTVD